MLNKRCVDIIKHLVENENRISIKELAEKFELSERSIRYDIDNINYYFKKSGLNQMEKTSRGTFEIEEKKENLLNLLNLLDSQFYVFSKNERKEYIKSKILFNEDIIKLHELSENLSVSLSTVKLDLKEIKIFLNESDLKLKFLSKIGLILSGNEDKIRHVQLRFLLNYIKIFQNEITSKKTHGTPGTDIVVDVIREYFYESPLDSIMEFIKDVSEGLKMIISEEAYRILQYYLMISIKRIGSKELLKTKIQNENFLKGTTEYSVILEKIPALEKKCNIKCDEKELLKLTELFLGSHSYNFNSSFYANWIELEVSVNELIREVGDNIGVDFSSDRVLIDGLINHLRPAIYRIKNDISLENPISEEVREVYGDLYHTIEVVVNKTLKTYIGKDIPEEEISYLTIHFKTAIDRKVNLKSESKNVVLVCGFGYGSSKLLAQKLQEKYDLNIMDILPYHQFVNADLPLDIDIVISTIDIGDQINYPFPVVKVNPILSKQDRDKLEEYGLLESPKKVSLSRLMGVIKRECQINDEEKLISSIKKLLKDQLYDDMKEQKKYTLYSLLKESSIIFDAKAKNWEEAVRISGEILVKNGSVDKSYTEDMVESVKKNGAYMIVGNKIALPHARVNNNVHRTDMSLVRFSEPVEFPDGKKIRIMLAFSSFDRNEHIEALVELINLIEDEEFFQFLLTCEEPFIFREYLEKFEK
jgi:transcriptional antiterminator